MIKCLSPIIMQKLQKIVNPRENLSLQADNHSLHGSILVSSKETNSKNESAVHPDYVSYWQSIK